MCGKGNKHFIGKAQRTIVRAQRNPCSLKKSPIKNDHTYNKETSINEIPHLQQMGRSFMAENKGNLLRSLFRKWRKTGENHTKYI